MDDLFQTLVATGHGKHTNNRPEAGPDASMGAAFVATFKALQTADGAGPAQDVAVIAGTSVVLGDNPKRLLDTPLPQTLPTTTADPDNVWPTQPVGIESVLGDDAEVVRPDPPSMTNLALSAQLADAGPLASGRLSAPTSQDPPLTLPADVPDTPPVPTLGSAEDAQVRAAEASPAAQVTPTSEGSVQNANNPLDTIAPRVAETSHAPPQGKSTGTSTAGIDTPVHPQTIPIAVRKETQTQPSTIPSADQPSSQRQPGTQPSADQKGIQTQPSTIPPNLQKGLEILPNTLLPADQKGSPTEPSTIPPADRTIPINQPQTIPIADGAGPQLRPNTSLPVADGRNLPDPAAALSDTVLPATRAGVGPTPPLAARATLGGSSALTPSAPQQTISLFPQEVGGTEVHQGSVATPAVAAGAHTETAHVSPVMLSVAKAAETRIPAPPVASDGPMQAQAPSATFIGSQTNLASTLTQSNTQPMPQPGGPQSTGSPHREAPSTRIGGWTIPAPTRSASVATAPMPAIVQSLNQQFGASTVQGNLVDPLPEMDVSVQSISVSTTSSLAPPVAVVGQAPSATAQVVAQQIAAAMSNKTSASDAPLELALDPPELGRVRLQITELAGVMTLMIQAERPETADLMRRHLELLAQEFAQAGLDAPSVHVSQDDGGQGSQPSQEQAVADRDAPHPTADAAATSPQFSRATSGGLDLRL